METVYFDNNATTRTADEVLEDVSKYGAYKAQQWLKQGKYNLNKNENEIANLCIEKKYANLLRNQNRVKEIDKILSKRTIDWHNTEAVHQWKTAYEAEKKYY